MYGEFERQEDGSKYCVIYSNVFNSMCKKGGYSAKTFLSWAAKNGHIKCQGDRYTKVKKVNGAAVRCVYLLIKEADEIIHSDDDLPM